MFRSTLTAVIMLGAATVAAGQATGHRVQVNGMRMYYEVSGAGEPLVVLHGAYMNIPTMGGITAAPAKTHRDDPAHGRDVHVGAVQDDQRLTSAGHFVIHPHAVDLDAVTSRLASRNSGGAEHDDRGEGAAKHRFLLVDVPLRRTTRLQIDSGRASRRWERRRSLGPPCREQT